ncbi:SPFH domain-containing protein [Haloglycomyces albus]|uniref:SPFH domain-containing protein n=1 Tax=Haloglycomyces albus TaxID=526067 RepID=UPI00046CDF74|nr:SPFH domain-containing protein [Haloglycomyces albus]
MGLWDKITGEFIDIIEWTDDSRDTIVWRFPRHNNEIKMGAQLVVRETQVAVFVNEGQLADVYTPGTYTLETQNMPVLSTLKGWKHGFESPFKAEVYFVNTRQFTDFKWGTKNPIMVRDAEFGPVRIRAFGAYSVRVIDPAVLLRETVGTDQHFQTEEIGDFLREKVVAAVSPALARAQIPVLDMAMHQDQIGDRIKDTISGQLNEFGLEVPNFTVSNISLPPEVEEAMDKRSSMGIVGDLNAYTQFQAANAVEASAENGGAGGDAMAMGAGFGMAQQMAQDMGGQQGQQFQGQQPPPQQQYQQQPPAQAQPPAAPPPIPGSQPEWFAALGGQQAGPFDVPTLQQKAGSGEFTRDTLVWKNGMANWTPASDVPELASVFGSVPPPLPPQ